MTFSLMLEHLLSNRTVPERRSANCTAYREENVSVRQEKPVELDAPILAIVVKACHQQLGNV